MDTRKTKGKVIDPIDFTPDTIQGILPKEFALELVRRYKEAIAPIFDPAMKVMMFGSYAIIGECPDLADIREAQHTLLLAIAQHERSSIFHKKTQNRCQQQLKTKKSCKFAV